MFIDLMRVIEEVHWGYRRGLVRVIERFRRMGYRRVLMRVIGLVSFIEEV